MDESTTRALREAEELVLVTRGRKTGRTHEVTLWFAYEDGAVWLRTDRGAQWYRNLLREGRCSIRIGATELDGVVEAVDDETAALRKVVDLWRAKYGVDYVADWYVDRGRVPVQIRLLR